MAEEKAVPITRVQARFRFEEAARVRCHHRSAASGNWEPVEGLRVKLYPTQAEPFGSATPGGQLEMVIAAPGTIAFFNGLPIGQELDAVFSPVEKPADGSIS